MTLKPILMATGLTLLLTSAAWAADVKDMAKDQATEMGKEHATEAAKNVVK